MKFIGQFIQNLIARFRSDVYLENVSESAQDHVVGIDANGKLYKQDAASGDITGVDLTGTAPITIGSETNTTSGAYSATLSIDIGNGLNVVGGDLVTNDGEIDHDSLDNFVAAEHFTQANITTTGTITTGVWQGTAIATDYLKHKTTFELAGYSTADGTNYMMADIMSGNKAPFLHDETSIGANGTTADNPAAFLRAAGTVMPYNGALKIWKGWSASAGSGTIDIAIFKYTPTENDATNDSLVLVKNTQYTAAGNDNLIAFSETSFSVSVAAGDILITAMKGSTSSKTAYFVSTVEIEWS